MFLVATLIIYLPFIITEVRGVKHSEFMPFFCTLCWIPLFGFPWLWLGLMVVAITEQ